MFSRFLLLLYNRHLPHYVSVKHLIVEIEAHDITLRITDSFNVKTQDMSHLLNVNKYRQLLLEMI